MASREILSLNTATPQIVAPQTGDTYSAPRAVAISPEPLTGTSATTSLDIAQTWNTTGTPTAVKLNVTDTASNAASRLMDLQTGGTSRFGVLKDGNVYLQGGASTHFIANSNGGGLACNSFGTLNDGAYDAIYSGYGVRFTSDSTLGWAATSTVGIGGGTPDTILARDAANTLAQRNATNAQTFRVYNTYTDASNYERGVFDWSTTANTLTIGSQKLGTGAVRNVSIVATGNTIQIAPGNTNTWKFDGASGSFLANSDNAWDIGASGATRPRIGYFGTRVDAPTLRTDTAYTVATLPAAGVAGRRAYVTDATAPAFLGALIGGGAVICPVFDNGTAWVAG